MRNWLTKNWVRALLTILCILVLGFPAWAGAGSTGAEFLKMGGGARPLAMGEAYVALADDASSAFWNPSGLARMEFPEVLYMHNQWFIDIKQQYFSFAYPSKSGTFGVSYSLLDSGDIQGYSASGSREASFKTLDTCLAFSWARKFGDRFSLGLSLKSISEQLEKYQASTTAMDMGLQFDLNPRISFGLALENLGTPLKFISEETPLPRTLRVGAVLRNKVFGDHLNVTADYVNFADGATGINLGAEFLLKELLALRAGSSRGYLRAGVGITIGSFGLDYAYLSRPDLGAAYQVSMSYSLGSEDKKKALILDYVTLAKAYFDQGKYAEAMVEAKKALSLDPEQAEARVLLSKATAGLEERAAGKVETVVKSGREAEISVYLEGGKKFMAEKQYLEAIGEFNKALKVDPSHAEAVKLAREAQAALQKQVAAKVKMEVDERIGRALKSISTGDYQGALVEVEKVLQMDPGNVEALKLKKRLNTILKI